jgi:hypothetical protein
MTSSTDEPSLEAECSQCAALCCVALAFDNSDQFAIDKPAGEPCRNLLPEGRCSIHASLESDGFRGCAAYTCLGAGQRVTQDLFGGLSWQQDRRLLAPMMDAFRTMRKVHELLLLLREAARLPLSAADRSALRRLQLRLTPEEGWTRHSLAAFETARTEDEFMEFLGTLKVYASALRNSA